VQRSGNAFVVLLTRYLTGCPYFSVVRQVVTDGNDGAAQLVERRANNWKVTKPWLLIRLPMRYSASLCPNATLGPRSLLAVMA